MLKSKRLRIVLVSAAAAVLLLGILLLTFNYIVVG